MERINARLTIISGMALIFTARSHCRAAGRPGAAEAGEPLALQLSWYGICEFHWSMGVMDTILFPDHGIVVFAIAISGIALMLSVLGLTTTSQTRSDIQHELKGLS